MTEVDGEMRMDGVMATEDRTVIESSLELNGKMKLDGLMEPKVNSDKVEDLVDTLFAETPTEVVRRSKQAKTQRKLA